MCFSAMLFDISVCMHHWCLVYSFYKEVLSNFKLLLFSSLRILDWQKIR